MQNPTKAELQAYKEKLQRGQGLNLDPMSEKEIKRIKSKNPIAKESDDEARLDGTKNYQYFKGDDCTLGSLPLHDDYSEEGEL